MTYDEFRRSTWKYGTRYSYQGREVSIVGDYGSSGKLLVSYDLDTVTHYQTEVFDIDVADLEIIGE